MFDATTPTAVLGLLAGGVLFLLYGVRLITEAMQRAAGARLRRATMKLAGHPFATLGVRVLATALTQSSGATSAFHLDLLNAMSRVLSHASNIAHAIHGDL